MKCPVKDCTLALTDVGGLAPGQVCPVHGHPSMIGLVNAHMLGATAEPGEHVNWAEVEVMSEATFVSLVEMSVAEYAEASPHMIVFEVTS